MKKLLSLGIVFLIMVVSVTAFDTVVIPEITLTYDSQNFDNVEVGDNNIYDIYCYGEGSICHIYRTKDQFTDLTGD